MPAWQIWQDKVILVLEILKPAILSIAKRELSVSAKTETSRTSRSRVVSDGEGESERETERVSGQAVTSLKLGDMLCRPVFASGRVLSCPKSQVAASVVRLKGGL